MTVAEHTGAGESRHTFASTLLSGGVSVAAAAEYLGHTPGVLLSTYAHLLPAHHERTRRVVEAAFAEGSRVTGVSGVSAGSALEGDPTREIGR